MIVGQSPAVAEMSTDRRLNIHFVAFENSKISLLHVPVQDEIEDLQGEKTSVDMWYREKRDKNYNFMV